MALRRRLIAGGALALLGLLGAATPGARAQSALAVGGFGVRQAEGAADAAAAAGRAEDVGGILARLLGLGAGAGADGRALPTGDLFARPRACLVVEVHGVERSGVMGSGTPFLGALFRGPHLELSGGDAPSLGRVEAALKARYPAALFASAADGDALRPSAEQAADGAPDVLHLRLWAGDMTNLGELDAAVARASERLSAAYGGHLAIEVALLGSAAGGANRRVLAGGVPRTVTRIKESDQMHLLIVWTCVVLILVLLFIFICIPWSVDLDPILYAALSKDSDKLD
jgi:hypothetical protein